MCVQQCPTGQQTCNNSCVNTQTDARNCGGCNNTCATDEVCVAGNCRQFEIALGCTTCPCPISCGGGGFNQCCTYPKDPTLVICVQANNCPAP